MFQDGILGSVEVGIAKKASSLSLNKRYIYILKNMEHMEHSCNINDLTPVFDGTCLEHVEHSFVFNDLAGVG